MTPDKAPLTDVTPEWLAIAEKEARDHPTLLLGTHNILSLCASLRKAWAERDEARDECRRVCAQLTAYVEPEGVHPEEGAFIHAREASMVIARLTAERDAAVAQAQASGEEARVLREALGRAIHFMGNAGCHISEEIGEDGWAAYCAAPTAHAKLAAAKDEVIAAERLFNELELGDPRWPSAIERRKAAYAALAVAECAAGVSGDA